MKEPSSAPDPQQLPLGMHEGDPLVPVEALALGGELAIVPLREPPVCGEWSYDDSELEQTRFVALRIDGVLAPTSKATPVMPIRVLVDPRAIAARQRPALSVAEHAPARPDGASRRQRPTVDALRLAFEQSPGDSTRALTYVAALERSGDSTTALKVLDKAKDAGVDLFAIECARASALGVLLKYDDAAKAIKAAAKIRSDDPEIQIQSGILACRRGRWKDAIEPLQKGVAAVPTHAQAFYYIGEALNQTDRLEEARAAYERAAELEPEHWRAIKGVGMVLDRLGRSTDAAVWYRRARDAQRS